MITSAQLRAARAMLGISQRKLAELSMLSLPTIQRMETTGGVIRGNVDSLMKLVEALDAAGIELISDGAQSSGSGRGVRLKERSTPALDRTGAGNRYRKTRSLRSVLARKKK
jgi:transcriptional regulator with XRE-family HTH domain